MLTNRSYECCESIDEAGDLVIRIVITGATASFGKLIVKKLAERLPATQIGASCRDLEKAANLSRRLGVRVRRAELTDAGRTLAAAFGAAGTFNCVI